MSDLEIGETQILYSHCVMAKIEPDGHVAICNPENGEAAFDGAPNGIQLQFVFSALPDVEVTRIEKNALALINKNVQDTLLSGRSVVSKRQEDSTAIIEINLTMRPGTDIDLLMRSAADAYYKMRKELLPQHAQAPNLFRRLFGCFIGRVPSAEP